MTAERKHREEAVACFEHTIIGADAYIETGEYGRKYGWSPSRADLAAADAFAKVLAQRDARIAELEAMPAKSRAPGVTTPVNVATPRTCQRCIAYARPRRDCPRCGGTGKAKP